MAASTVRLPMKVWLCDAPGFPGKTIGSSLFMWLKPQPTTKYSPPGKRLRGLIGGGAHGEGRQRRHTGEEERAQDEQV